MSNEIEITVVFDGPVDTVRDYIEWLCSGLHQCSIDTDEILDADGTLAVTQSFTGTVQQVVAYTEKIQEMPHIHVIAVKENFSPV